MALGLEGRAAAEAGLDALLRKVEPVAAQGRRRARPARQVSLLWCWLIDFIKGAVRRRGGGMNLVDKSRIEGGIEGAESRAAMLAFALALGKPRAVHELSGERQSRVGKGG